MRPGKKDAFSMSDEEFAAALQNAGDPLDTGEEEEAPPESGDNAEPEDEQDEGGEPREKKQPRRFTLEDEDTEPEGADEGEPAEDSGEDGEQQEFVEIIHNGEKKQITREQMVKLAQKGFDYESKTAQIAPYRKIGELLQSDPELARQVNDIINQRAQGRQKPPPQSKPEPPKLKGLDEYDSEADWFRDNYEALSKQNQPPAPEPKTAMPDISDPNVRLQLLDPHYSTVAKAAFEKYLPNLTVAQHDRVGKDPEAFQKFYNFVREEEGFGALPGYGQQQAPPPPQEPRRQPQFRVQSGGGTPPREKKQKNAWELNNDEFNQLLSKVKGY